MEVGGVEDFGGVCAFGYFVLSGDIPAKVFAQSLDYFFCVVVVGYGLEVFAEGCFEVGPEFVVWVDGMLECEPG